MEHVVKDDPVVRNYVMGLMFSMWIHSVVYKTLSFLDGNIGKPAFPLANTQGRTQKHPQKFPEELQSIIIMLFTPWSLSSIVDV
jgi:hypothetical protein